MKLSSLLKDAWLQSDSTPAAEPLPSGCHTATNSDEGTHVRAGWPDAEPLLQFTSDPRDVFTIRDAVAGTVVFGITGSGKTSGSGSTLAHAYLRAGFGALVLCVKPDEPSLWLRYAADVGRAEDIVLFGRDDRWAFNFLDYEARRPGIGGGLTENLIQLFVEVAAIGNGETAGGKGDDPFWDRAMRSLIRNLIDLVLLGGRPLTLSLMFDTLRSAPLDVGFVNSASHKLNSVWGTLLSDAERRCKGTVQEHDFRQVNAYWTREFPSMPDRTRGSVIELFRTMAEALLRGKMNRLFCDQTTLIPEHALAGKIVVVDLPVKEWGEVGRYAGVLWKYCMQKAIERRSDNLSGSARPVVIWADEFQFFASKYDFLFQTTARSSRAATVYLTQTVSGLLAQLGAEGNGKARVEALLANLDTKIFHANSDRETNQWAADLIGKTRLVLNSASTNDGVSIGQGLSRSLGSSASSSEQIDYELQPRVFTTFRKGGTSVNCLVDALVYQTGRNWSTGQSWICPTFRQTA